MRHLPVAAAMAAATALCVGTAVPASAADTTTTFAVTAGLLTISAPTSKSLGSGAAGKRIGASLGSVTVNDARGLIGAAWTASVSSSDFSNTTTPAAPVIGKAAVSYAGPCGDHRYCDRDARHAGESRRAAHRVQCDGYRWQQLRDLESHRDSHPTGRRHRGELQRDDHLLGVLTFAPSGSVLPVAAPPPAPAGFPLPAHPFG